MSKSYKKKPQEEDFEDNGFNPKRNAIDKRKKKRFIRAMKIRDIDGFLEYEDHDEFSR